MRTVILVPWRAGDPQREANWAWARSWWERHFPEYDIYEGHDDGPLPFNRSAAINDAARRAGAWDVALIVDADVFPVDRAQVTDAVQLASVERRLVRLYGRVCYLDADFSAKIMRTGAFGGYELHIEWEYHDACGAGNAVSRELWDDVRGFDERFVGWGHEDVTFGFACQILGGPDAVMGGDLLHLWHEAERIPPPNNMALHEEYCNVINTGTAKTFHEYLQRVKP